MTTRISSSVLKFGSQAVGASDTIALSFLEKCTTSSLADQVVVIGQSVKSFIDSLPPTDDLRLNLSELTVSAGNGAKGWSGSSHGKIGGRRTRLQVFMTPTEASRHNNPFRADSVTKSLQGQVADMIGDAAKSSDNRISIICAVPTADAIKSTSFGIARALPRFTRKTDRGKDIDPTKPVVGVQVSFHVASGEPVTKEMLESISIISDCIRMSQTLTDTPPNELNVTTYVSFVKDIVATLPGVELKVIQGKDLESQGFGGVWNVGKGNTTNPPALVVLSHRNQGSEDKSVVLVGKGIVYDSGGLAIKPRDGMCGMKADMSGSAAMLSAFTAMVRMGGLPSGEPLHCVLCLAENSIGPDSFRNDDIIRIYSGLTVEINNTDAEGRLVLADGCSYAAKHLNPKLVIDMATLTGAQGIATGQNHAAVLASHDEDEKSVVDAAKASGDLAFPIVYCPEFHRTLYKSEVADMKNSVSNRMDAASSASGWFIYDHMNAAGYTGNWVHLDMAGPAVFTGTGRGTGYGVGLITTLLSGKGKF
jgi:probable aminopeptidase NPEPL1